MSGEVSSEPLANLPVGGRGRVTGFELRPDQRQRLLELGMTTGAELEVIRFAPLGDPIEIKVRGYCLSLRKHEAQGIFVQRVS
jgi:Fe2+ transport system protein FeoA